ncbi:MAG: HlyD family efflux transporter periplasmic adaptor subunit [Verrucomicrobiales bacterium]|nr:HlyD family efflux transporter periplasmic adaptor subunit [Verrucomicrobiales bacterium]
MNAQKVNNTLSLLVCLLLAGLIVVVLLGGQSGSEEEGVSSGERELRRLTVNTIDVEPADSFALTRTYTGVTRPKESVDLGFSKAGTVIEINAGPGDSVSKGDVLAKLDTRRLELQKEKIDDALSKSAGSPGRGNVTEADADLVDLDLEDSILKAPFAGEISAQQMSVGSVASPGMPVFRIVGGDQLEVWVGVPVEVADEISEGEFHDLTIGENTFSTPVTAILPEVDQSARTRTVVFSLDESVSDQHRPGEVVDLTLTRTKSIPGYWLPLTALSRETRGLWSAFVVEGEGEEARVARHYVEVVHVENDRAWIRGTLDGKVKVIADGTHRIVPGQPIAIAGEEGNPEEPEELEESGEGEPGEPEETKEES